MDDFYSFNFSTNTWEEVKVLSDQQRPGCRENNGVVISDSSRSIYLFGGYNGSNWLNDLWKFDIESQKWTCIQESSDPRPTENDQQQQQHVAGHLLEQQNMVLVGDALQLQQQQQQQRLLLQQQQQQGVRGRVPSRRFGYVSVVHNNKLVLFGGFDGQRWLNDMYVFDFSTKIWTEIQARGTVPSVRSCPAWAKDDTHVYIQGGYDGVERKADFFALELATYTWVQMPSLGTPPSPRYFHSCCLYGNKMYLYGGYSGTERLADMFAYDFETNHWCEVDCSNGEAPSGRSSLVAQVYENCLYVFGGYNGTTVLNDFYKFRLKPISVPPPLLVHDLRRLMNHPDLSDVTFQVEGQLVYANRAILAVRSEYFRVMLYSGGMRESIQAATTDTSKNNPIPLVDVSYLVFLKVMEFLYTDTVSDVSLDVGIHLLIASEQFMLDRLKALCEEVIRREITVDNVIGILAASHRHNASGLKDIALEFILRNLNDPAIMRGLTVCVINAIVLLGVYLYEWFLCRCRNRKSHLGLLHVSCYWC